MIFSFRIFSTFIIPTLLDLLLFIYFIWRHRLFIFGDRAVGVIRCLDMLWLRFPFLPYFFDIVKQAVGVLFGPFLRFCSSLGFMCLQLG